MTNKILTIAISLLALFACNKKDINSLKDDVSDLQTRVTVLEELCKQNNTNITSLQTIVNASNTQGDYITSVTPITKEGKEIGYTIAFAKQAAITIYNGEDGVSAQAPEISVKKFTDNIYYWTLNGDWLLDDNEEKIQVAGKNGSNGTDGITPQLKVEDDNWYVSYDKGTTWNYISKAKGEDGKDGDSMFKEVTYDDSFVYFTLTDDTVLKIAKHVAVVTIEKGAIKAAFSVAEGKQVYFSQGNLQYQASTNTWRFACNQYDMIGEGNANVAEDYDGWIDFFSWGTSGWAESGAVCYQPWSTSSTNSDYYVGGSYENNLTGAYANADWGVYNKIANGGNQEGMWRVLTTDEWDYLMNTRVDAKNKRGVATVNGINGLIILPDNYVLPEGISFVSGFASGTYNRNLYQTVNSYNLTQWSKLESIGAIFLPAHGYFKYETNTFGNFNNTGVYWTSTFGNENEARYFDFNSSGMVGITNAFCVRHYKLSVRLVQDIVE